VQKKFDEDEIVSIMNRGTRNCPWSGEQWASYMRYLAQVDSYPFEDLVALKEKATSIPWLSAQSTELVKFYFAWITICKLRVSDWDEQIEDVGFLETELDECLDKTGSGTPLCATQINRVVLDCPDGYLLGKLAVHVKTLANDPEQAREIWDTMSKSNGTRCDYWLDRMAWEK